MTVYSLNRNQSRIVLVADKILNKPENACFPFIFLRRFFFSLVNIDLAQANCLQCYVDFYYEKQLVVFACDFCKLFFFSSFIYVVELKSNDNYSAKFKIEQWTLN